MEKVVHAFQLLRTNRPKCLHRISPSRYPQHSPIILQCINTINQLNDPNLLHPLPLHISFFLLLPNKKSLLYFHVHLNNSLSRLLNKSSSWNHFLTSLYRTNLNSSKRQYNFFRCFYSI